MANQYPQVLKIFEHLKKTAGGTPAELKPNEGEKFIYSQYFSFLIHLQFKWR